MADFKKLKPSADALADLMVSYMEWATKFTHDYGDMWEQYYTSVEGNFGKTVKHIVVNDLWEIYDYRLRQCVEWASVCGYGFADTIADLYEEGKTMHCNARTHIHNHDKPHTTIRHEQSDISHNDHW